MNSILMKLALLTTVLIFITCGWFAFAVDFKIPLFNILLGIVALFFLFRSLELVDIINKLGPHSEEKGEGCNDTPYGQRKGAHNNRIPPEEEGEDITETE